MLGKSWRQLLAFWEAWVAWCPGAAGIALRRRYWRSRLADLGEGAVFGTGLFVAGPERIRIGGRFSCWRLCTLSASEDGAIEIGDRVSFNSHVYLNASNHGRLTIGNDVLVGPNVVFRTSDHVAEEPGQLIRTQGHHPGTTALEDDVWVGANAVILGGVRIGRGAVVAAGAVVTRDVEPLMVVGGVPARVLRRRGEARE